MKISLTAMLLLCLSTTVSFAQEESQTKRSKFGIYLGINTILPSVQSKDSVDMFASKMKPGFTLGVLNRYRLSNVLALRTQAEFSFFDLEFIYYSDFIKLTEIREMVNIELPIHLVFEKAYKKMTSSVSVGGRYRYDFAVEEVDFTDFNGKLHRKVSRFRKDDVLLDVCLGAAFEMNSIIFKPEFVYSRGLLNQPGKLSDPSLGSVIRISLVCGFCFMDLK